MSSFDELPYRLLGTPETGYWDQLTPDYADLISIAGPRHSVIERKRGWRRDSIRHNSEGAIIRGTWSSHGKALLGLVEQETIELCFHVQLPVMQLYIH